MCSPLRINWNKSNEKVEKVVRPPQKPIPNKAYVAGLSWSLCNNATNMPNSKHPKLLTSNVGSHLIWFVFTHIENKKRKQLPNPPPKKMSNNCLLIDDNLFHRYMNFGFIHCRIIFF